MEREILYYFILFNINVVAGTKKLHTMFNTSPTQPNLNLIVFLITTCINKLNIIVYQLYIVSYMF